MSAANHDEVVTQFIGFTQCPTDEAVRYLEAANWDISVATDLFFGSEGPIPSDPVRPAPPASNPQIASGGTGGYESDDESPFQAALEESLRSHPAQAQGASKDPKGTTSKKPAEKSRFGTLSNLKKDEENSDEEEGQAFYAGGSDRSGQQIIGPPRPKDNDKNVAKLFDAARKQGAMEADDDDQGASSQTRKEKAFGGVGYTLGDDRTPSRTTAQTGGPTGGAGAGAAAAAAGSTPGRAEQVLLRFFSNGFTVGDSELRSYQENQDFMDHIKRGEVPPELRNLSAAGKQVEVRLEDHRGEEYRPTAPVFKPFAGAGHMLGSPSPTVTATASNVKSAMTTTATGSNAAVDTGRLEKLAQQHLKTSNSSTTIRLRLPDASAPLNVAIDLTRTLAEVRQFLQENIPSLQSNQFEFIEPPSIKIRREDEKKTISEAKLTNAALVIRRSS